MGNIDKQANTEAERSARPSEALDLEKGVKTARWKQETTDGNYFHKTSYKTFYIENAENDEEETNYVDTVWFGAHQIQEVFKGVQNWNQRDAVKPAEKEQFVEPVGRTLPNHPNMTIFSIGDVSVTVLDQHSPNGNPYRVFVMSVDYKDNAGEWQKSHSFTRGQNIKLEKCLSGAMNYMKTPMKMVEGVESHVTQTVEEDEIPF